jgi:uncharacterized membrane protein YhaH (DUF805 family)
MIMKNIEWFLNPVKYQYTDFTGRATREQYWMFTLWSIIISIGLGIVTELLDLDIVAPLFTLAVLLPSLAIGARRLHDTGKSGWWQLIALIPIIGWIILIIFLVTKSDVGANKYGPDPVSGKPPVPDATAVPNAFTPTAPTVEPAPGSDEQRPPQQ